MGIMAKILRNTTLNSIVIADLHGLTIDPNATYDITNLDPVSVATSVDLINELTNGSIKYNDGSKDIASGEAINILRGIVTPLLTDKDGRQYVVSSTRPLSSVMYWTDRGDTLLAPKVGAIGNGAELLFDVAPGATSACDLRFTEDINFFGGKVIYMNAQLGSSISSRLIAPAGMPYLAKSSDGNFDKVGGNWIPNSSNTGAYWISNTETVLHKFINNMPLLGSGQDTAIAPEPQSIPSGYTIRISITNSSASTENLKAAFWVLMYRPTTYDGNS